MPALLVFDTATEHLFAGLSVDGRRWVHEGAGGAQASAALLPAVLELLARAGIALGQLDAIGFGRGPGAFTGLRTSASVAQGLAFGTGRPVIAIDSLLAVAEDARDGAAALSIWVAMDARMNEIYAARYRFDATGWQGDIAPALYGPSALEARWLEAPADRIAGNALAAFPGLATGAARRVAGALPRPDALLTLANVAWQAGELLDAAEALPVYVRDKVALTTAEREAARLAGAVVMPATEGGLRGKAP